MKSCSKLGKLGVARFLEGPGAVLVVRTRGADTSGSEQNGVIQE